MRRTILLLAVATLAGCLAGVGPPATGGPPDADWAAGDSIDASALAERHFEALRAAGSFTTNHSEQVRVAGDARPDGPVPEGYHPPSHTRVRVDLAAGRLLRRDVTVGHRRSARFVSPDVWATRRAPCSSGDCAVEYDYRRRPAEESRSRAIDRYRSDAAADDLATRLRGVTVGFEYAHAGTVTRDGERLHRYRAEKDLASAPPPFAEPPTGTATVLVTPAGVVREFTLEYTGPATVTVDGEPRTVTVTQASVWTYTAVGETAVERPGWLEQARDADPPRETATGGT